MHARSHGLACKTCLPDVDDWSKEKQLPFGVSWWGVVFPMVTLTMSTYQIHTDTEWRFFKVVGRVLAAILTLAACYIHALTIKHAVTPKFWHGFHPKQP